MVKSHRVIMEYSECSFCVSPFLKNFEINGVKIMLNEFMGSRVNIAIFAAILYIPTSLEVRRIPIIMISTCIMNRRVISVSVWVNENLPSLVENVFLFSRIFKSESLWNLLKNQEETRNVNIVQTRTHKGREDLYVSNPRVLIRIIPPRIEVGRNMLYAIT